MKTRSERNLCLLAVGAFLVLCGVFAVAMITVGPSVPLGVVVRRVEARHTDGNGRPNLTVSGKLLRKQPMPTVVAVDLVVTLRGAEVARAPCSVHPQDQWSITYACASEADAFHIEASTPDEHGLHRAKSRSYPISVSLPLVSSQSPRSSHD